MTRKRPALFRGRHFEDAIILLCVRWYLRYSLTYRDLEEIMAERGLSIDHVTMWRWVQRYAPVLNQRIRRKLRRPNRSWRVDETYVKVAGDWAGFSPDREQIEAFTKAKSCSTAGLIFALGGSDHSTGFGDSKPV